MSKAISNTQKQAILVNIPNSVTIGSTTYTATKIWANQVHDEITHATPVITLNMPQEGLKSGIKEVNGGSLYYLDILTVHIEGRSGAVNGAHLCEALAQAIITGVSGWVTPLTGDVRIFDPDSDISAIGLTNFTTDYFDYTLSINLYHA